MRKIRELVKNVYLIQNFWYVFIDIRMNTCGMETTAMKNQSSFRVLRHSMAEYTLIHSCTLLGLVELSFSLRDLRHLFY